MTIKWGKDGMAFIHKRPEDFVIIQAATATAATRHSVEILVEYKILAKHHK